ncbi:hypothetical protein CL6EHI_081920 [Entamoeba histolytica]|uniref:Uncharacterized protein n=1 Tax=Entamoeba histolytica TaxID=5759 RepID=A0A175JTK2_ENTHI|nr:hypothetical protein CL6EHI_081920 [Entamoeba histolytica]
MKVLITENEKQPFINIIQRLEMEIGTKKSIIQDIDITIKEGIKKEPSIGIMQPLFRNGNDSTMFHDNTRVEDIPIVENLFVQINQEEMNKLKKVFEMSETCIMVNIQRISLDIETKELVVLNKITDYITKFIIECCQKMSEPIKQENDIQQREERSIIEEEDIVYEKGCDFDKMIKIIQERNKAVRDTYIYCNVDCIKITLRNNTESMEMKMNGIEMINPQNIFGLGLTLTYYQVEEIEIKMNYIQRGWIDKIEKQQQTIIMNGRNSYFTFINHEMTNTEFEDIIHYFKPRNMNKASLYQFSFIRMTSGYSFEEFFRLYSLLMSMSSSSSSESHQIDNNSKDSTIEDYSHSFFTVDNFVLLIEQIKDVPLQNTTSITIKPHKLFGHYISNQNEMIGQIESKIELNQIEVGLSCNFKYGKRTEIYVPSLNISGEIDIQTISKLINTTMMIITFVNPYQQPTETKVGNNKTHKTMKWKEWYEKDLITLTRIERKYDYECIEEMINIKKKGIKLVNETHLLLGNDIEPSDKNTSQYDTTIILDPINGESVKTQENESFLKTYRNEQTENTQEKKETNTNQTSCIIEIKVITIHLKLTREKEDFLSVDFEHMEMNVVVDNNGGTDVCCNLYKVNSSSNKEKEPIFQLDTTKTPLQIAFKTIIPKKLDGAKDEMGCSIGLYNNGCKLNIRLSVKILKQLYSMIKSCSGENNPLPKFVQEITPPPMLINLEFLEIQPIEGNFKIEGGIDLLKNTFSVPSTLLKIENVCGDINSLLNGITTSIEDKAMKKLYPLFLWILSGLFPQFANISGVKSFISSLLTSFSN